MKCCNVNIPIGSSENGLAEIEMTSFVSNRLFRVSNRLSLCIEMIYRPYDFLVDQVL